MMPSYCKQKWLTARRSMVFALLTCVSLAGCGGGGDGGAPAAPTPPVTPPPVTPPPVTPPPVTPPPTNAAPVFTGDAAAMAAENVIVTIDANITDPDGDALTFSLSGADAALFTFDEGAVAIISNATFDFEAPGDQDGNNSYQFSLSASDGTDDVVVDFTLSVTNISDVPPLIAGQFDLNTDEGESVMTAFAVSDADGDDIALTLSGPDAALFNLDSATLTISADEAFDFETPTDANADNVYEFQVTASDVADSTTQSFTLTVQNIIDAFEGMDLLDPNPATGSFFGSEITVLANGAIAVGKTRDSTAAFQAGAVHLFDPTTQALISSFFGAEISQEVGFQLTPLRDGNLVARSGAFGQLDALQAASSVVLLNGDNAAEIQTLGGDNEFDFFGGSGVVELLGPNQGRFVIASRSDGISRGSNEGSVTLVNGFSGETVARIEGDDPTDFFGGRVEALSNGNFVILSDSDDVNGFNQAGSAVLADGTTGVEIARFAGEAADELFGSRFAALPNGNFVLTNPLSDGAFVDEGTVLLINGVTGDLIAEIRGADVDATGLGNTLVALDNGNFVVSSADSSRAGLDRNGFVGLFDETGAVLASIAGDNNEDGFGGEIVVLNNGRFLSVNSNDDVDGQADVGSVIVFDSAGDELARLTGENAGDAFGFGGNFLATLLDNGNIVIPSSEVAVNGVPAAGSMRLIDGTDFTEIGRLDFDDEFDLGSPEGDIAVLPNGNFVILAPGDDVNGIEDAGSATLVDGSTGAILFELAGAAELELGSSSAQALASDHVVLATAGETAAGVSEAGVVRVINATTGDVLRTFQGDQANDRFGSEIVVLENGGFVIGNSNDNFNGLESAGSIILVTAQ
ncbi:MAG: hypothetical protein AB8G16_14485 [Gammaproteobacteria bacterium]